MALLVPARAQAAGVAVDASVTTHQTAAATSITSSPLSTASANDLLVAFLTSDGPSGSQSFKTVTGGGLTWRLRQRANGRPGTAEIWVAAAPGPVTNLTVNATRATGSYLGSITVVAFSGADTSLDGAVGSASVASGAPSVALTPLRSGSWVWGVGSDWSNAIARTAGASQTLVDQFLASAGDTYWVQRQSAAGSVAGMPVTLNDTAPTGDQYDFAAIEIPAAGLSAPADTTPPTTPGGLTATPKSTSEIDLSWSASSDDVGVAGYRVARDGTAVATVTATSYQDTGLTPSTQYRYTVTAVDAAGNAGAAAGPVTATTATPADTTPPAVSITQPAAGATVAGTATLSADARDEVGVAGVQFEIDGSPAGAEDTSAPYSLAWDSTRAGDGPHTITAVARDAAGNWTRSAPVQVTVANPAGTSPITLDTSVTTHQSKAAATIASPALTTTARNEVLVAFLASDGPTGSGTMSFSSVSGGGLTWRLRQRTNTQSGDAEIWQAIAPAPVDGLVVTATRAGGSYTGAITVAAFENAGTTADGAVGTANAASGAPSVTLTTTHAGSWVWAVGTDYDHATAHAAAGGQTKVDEYLSPSDDAYWVQRQNAATAAAGTAVTIADTAPTKDRYDLSAIELVPAGPPDATAPSVALTAPADGATLSGNVTLSADASDDAGVASVQFLLDGRPLGDPVTSAPYTLAWSSGAAANGDHVLSAVATDRSGNTATAADVHVTVANAGAQAPRLDPATPQAATVLNNVLATTSTSFSPPAGTVLYAALSIDSPAATPVNTVTSITNSGAPLTWHLLGRENHNDSSTGGFVEVWWAFNPTAQSGIAATASFAQPTKNVPAPVGDFQILVLDDAAADQSAAAVNTAYTFNLSSAVSVSLKTTAPSSRVFGVFDDWDNSNIPTPGAGQSVISNVMNATDRDGYWLQALDAPVATPGPVTLSATVNGNPNTWHALAWEVLGASG